MNEATELAALEQSARNLTVAIIPLALLVVGVVLGFVMRRKDKGEKFRFLPPIVCTILAVLGWFGIYTTAHNAPQSPVQSASAPEASSSSNAKITEQSSEVPAGSEALVLSPAEIAQTEAELAKRMAGVLKKAGYGDVPVRAKVLNMRSGEKIIARSTASAEGGIVLEQADGIVAGKQVMVICQPEDSRSFVFSGSECERRMRETFGNFVPLAIQSSGSK